LLQVSLDEILLTLGVDFTMHHLFMAEVGPFHVIFDLNGVLITTCFDKGSHNIILCLGLKELLEKCLEQFQVYIWSIA
jgi:hypothetical protein